jgi:hypothetical protein
MTTMKKRSNLSNLLLLVFFLPLFSALSQEVDTTTIKLGDANMTIVVEKNPENKKGRYYKNDKILGDHIYAHWSGLDIGVGMVVNSSFGTSFPNQQFLETDPASSWTFNINLFEHYFPIAKHNFGFVSGIGFNASHFGFKRNNNVQFDYFNDTITAFQDTIWNYSRNRLRAGYLQVPVLFQINTSADYTKNFHIAFGLLAGVRLGSDLKRKSTTNGERYTYSERGSFFLNPFKLDGTLRIGYRNWGAFASYNFIPLFDKNITDRAHVLSFGLSLTW